ncbi:MAG: electron transfer flavoprotein-ubiquinone oxidoreductase [Betaproteobacteria bacterium TMED41]|nr:MAG: electron transfer flavoprotein-ubiquinone oxidoreductase [Betaproteobacteria bacterium TMED41]
MTEEELKFDVLIIGAGPSGLSAAIKLKQLAMVKNRSLSICVIEKSASLGGHIISGAIIDTVALSELLPNWQEENCPVTNKVTKDEFYFLLNKTQSLKIPSFLVPNSLKNNKCYISSLSDVVKWLGQRAEKMDIEIFTGFAATSLIYGEDGDVQGVKTGSFGVNRDGSNGKNFEPGISLKAKFTIFAEGSRGQLGKLLIDKFQLDKNSDPQNYALGIKELWEIPKKKSKPGSVIHTLGWPLGLETYGGSFLYHMRNNRVSIGLITGLNYKNPWISPFQEFQKLKTHPEILKILEGGKRIGYGARSLTAGSLYSLPKFVFPGGALIGCNAGFLNSARIKGSHCAIKSGILVAEAYFEFEKNNKNSKFVLLNNYEKKFKDSWLFTELNQAKNFKALMNKSMILGGILTFVEQNIFQNKTFFKIRSKNLDYKSLKKSKTYTEIQYPKPDGRISFDKLSSLPLSGVSHEENQPIHLKLKDAEVPSLINFKIYAGPETRYCPAGVYEYLDEKNQPVTQHSKEIKLQINAQNCLHCKACDIKDPTQNITWVAPEGGGGPNYEGM